MPAHEAEETTSGAVGSIFDKVAKESSDSTASDHEMHKEEDSVTSGGSQGKLASEQDHKAAPGIVQATDLGPKATKDELKERSAELNK